MQTEEDILNERFNSYINGKNARLELWPIGYNPHNIAQDKDLWMLWRLGWTVIDKEIRNKVSSLLSFVPKKRNN